MTTQRQQLTRQQQAIVNVRDPVEQALLAETRSVSFWWPQLSPEVKRAVLYEIEQLREK